MRTSRPILLASAAAAVLAAACSRDAAEPVGPTIAGSPGSPASGLFSVSASGTATDSVVAGYGNEACGGLDYLHFEYEPETGTEYVVCEDTSVTPTDTVRLPAPPRPAPPPPTTSPAPAPAPAPAPQPTTPDSVQSGYGSGSTGGLEYDRE